MIRRGFLIFVLFLVGVFSSCDRRRSPQLVIVHVLRDPSGQLAQKLTQATYQFDLTKPHLSAGKGVMIATYEGRSFPTDLQRLGDMKPELVILNSQIDLSKKVPGTDQLGKPETACGENAAYIPFWVSGEAREAAEMYLQFLAANCK